MDLKRLYIQKKKNEGRTKCKTTRNNQKRKTVMITEGETSSFSLSKVSQKKMLRFLSERRSHLKN